MMRRRWWLRWLWLLLMMMMLMLQSSWLLQHHHQDDLAIASQRNGSLFACPVPPEGVHRATRIKMWYHIFVHQWRWKRVPEEKGDMRGGGGWEEVCNWGVSMGWGVLEEMRRYLRGKGFKCSTWRVPSCLARSIDRLVWFSFSPGFNTYRMSGCDST